MKCFISSPFGASLDTLIDHLEAMGVEHVDIRSAPPVSTWNEWVRDQIARSDMVIVVLPTTAPDPAAFLIEIGMALGLVKPILVIAPEGRVVPSALTGVQHVRASSNDSQLLQLHVRALVESASAQRTSTVRQSEHFVAQPDLAAWLGQSLQDLAALPAQAVSEKARSLEALVVELFRRAGGLVETAIHPLAGDQPDMAVLFDQFPALAGPLLVDVKLYGYSRPPDKEHLLKLHRYVVERGAFLGVLLYWSPAGSAPAPTGSWPTLIILDLSALAEELEKRSLFAVLADARNRAVHGV